LDGFAMVFVSLVFFVFQHTVSAANPDYPTASIASRHKHLVRDALFRAMKPVSILEVRVAFAMPALGSASSASPRFRGDVFATVTPSRSASP
jgi:hypothetical protein